MRAGTDSGFFLPRSQTSFIVHLLGSGFLQQLGLLVKNLPVCQLMVFERELSSLHLGKTAGLFGVDFSLVWSRDQRWRK